MHDATGSRKVVVGKSACNIVMAIQLFLVMWVEACPFVSSIAGGYMPFASSMAGGYMPFASSIVGGQMPIASSIAGRYMHFAFKYRLKSILS